jgi:hypothetical protein
MVAAAFEKTVMHKHFILLFGMLLGNHGQAALQTPAPRIVPTQAHVTPVNTMLPTLTITARLEAASFQMAQDPGGPTADFGSPFAGAYERDYNLKNLLPVDKVKTLVLTQSSLPLVQFWGGRLELGAFQSTLYIENVERGLYSNKDMQGARLPQQNYSGGPRSVTLFGLGLSFQFGRETRTERPTNGWRCLSRIVGTILN